MTLALRNYGLVLPKNYVSIEKDEMEYIDGGGTVDIYFSSRAIAIILTYTISFAVGIIAATLSVNPIVGIISGYVASLACDYIFNNVWCPKDFHICVNQWWLPDFKFSYK